jgi:hypothetical protein
MIGVGGLAAMAVTGLRAEAERGATVAPFKTPPVIDGRIVPGEWDGAVAVVGFQDIQNGRLDARLGHAYCGFTQDRLYVAVVSEVSPAGAIANQKNRDSDVIWDEAIEIWLDPNRDTRAAGGGDLRYYQFMGNAIGTILDVAFSSKGTPDTGWNAQWEFVNSVDMTQQIWTAELSVPWQDLGWPSGQAVGRSIGVLLARNYKNPWTQSTWFPHSGAFASWFAYPRIFLTADQPSVQITSLGTGLFKGELGLQARIFNPGGAGPVQVRTLATSSDMPELKDEKTLALPANGVVDYTFSIPPARFHEAAQHALELVVQSPDNKTPYLNYGMKWTQAPAKKWDVRTGADPETAVRMAYYPSYGFVRVGIDPRELEKGAEGIRAARVTLAAAGERGRRVFEERMTWTNGTAQQEFKVGDLAEGPYTLTVALDGYKTPFVRTFTRQRFPWEGTTLGITDEVLPPFTPIQVRKDTVAVVLREYTTDALGLWRSVKAEGNVSAGSARELLAAPIVLLANDEPLRGKGRFTQIRPNVVTHEGGARHPAVTVKTRCITEYDGCMKVELTLEPGSAKQELRNLRLEIPLQDKRMPLWHCSTAGLRQNPAGSTPAGQGVVWDSRMFSDGNWYGNFKPYLWVGAEERGLCWFADNDRGWELNVDPKNPAQSVPCLVLDRQGEVLTMRVNFIQKPVLLAEPRTIVFGLMASPAKPMPKDWRRIALTDSITFSMSYLGDNVCSAKTPRGGDFSIMDRMQQARRGEKVDPAAVWEEWAAKHVSTNMDAKVSARFRSLIDTELSWSAQRAPWFSYYFDEYHSTCQTHPEAHVFQSEWTGDWMQPLQKEYLRGDAAGSINVSGLVRSHQDFACWYGAEHIRRGIGLYLDNSFLKRAYDPLTTSAYRLPNGDLQPSAGAWAHREYQKRLWVMHQKLSPADTKAMMMVHMTNTELIPTMVFNMSNLDLEWFYGPEAQQSKYAHDLLRTETLGRQAGCIPLAIARVDSCTSKEQEQMANRTRFGAMMVHEIRPFMGEMGGSPEAKALLGFGYGSNDCAVFNYWDENNPVTVSDRECKTLLLKRANELLLMLVTWNPKPVTVDVSLDAKALAIAPTAALNAEKQDDRITFNATTGSFSLPLEGYGVKIIRIR